MCVYCQTPKCLPVVLLTLKMFAAFGNRTGCFEMAWMSFYMYHDRFSIYISSQPPSMPMQQQPAQQQQEMLPVPVPAPAFQPQLQLQLMQQQLGDQQQALPQLQQQQQQPQQHTPQTGHRGPGYSRKEKSLGLLCDNFLRTYDGSTIGTYEICLDEAASRLDVERRRIYDIVNVLESVGVVTRKQKNRYYSQVASGLLVSARDSKTEQACRFARLPANACIRVSVLMKLPLHGLQLHLEWAGRLVGSTAAAAGSSSASSSGRRSSRVV